MKYLLEEPNGNLHEISVPKNAAGQICYEKVNTLAIRLLCHCTFQNCFVLDYMPKMLDFSLKIFLFPPQLCAKLGIVEQHYFGLTRSINHETKAWLNLRNPLMAQLRPHITGKPHRLRLDVKFYVLPQEIQHERTRLAANFFHCVCY